MALPEVIKTALEHIQYIAKTETVFGEPVSVGGVTLIPISKVSMGFAAGGGAGKGEKTDGGSGTGGGVNVTPVAFISISASGEINVHTLDNNDVDIGKLLAKAPDAIKKVSKFFKRDDDGEDEDV